MNFLVNLGSSLLSFAHRIFSPDFCPGDWVWATIAAGAIIGSLPVVGMLLVALVRKGTGNTYNGATISVIAAAGGFFVFLMPWLFIMGVSEVFHSVALGNPSGLTGAQEQTVRQGVCWIEEGEAEFLGARSNVYEVLVTPSEGTPTLLLRITMLVAVPALILLFVWLQARSAMRRGPKWPARLLWAPYVLLVLLSVGATANVSTFLWLGFLPVSILGLMPLLAVGPPSWSVIERSYQKPEPPAQSREQRPAPPPPPPRQQVSQQPNPQNPPPYEPPPPLPAYVPPGGV
ncbi:MAG TPA: serine/threonine protein kinase, partial [Actinophytocola sp.]|nr:serine/threonine protein kinase [Actinophytocola sp.]